MFARARRARRARWSERYSEWGGALDGAAVEAIAELVPADRVFSPTSLETYAKCPQPFLLGAVVRARGVEEPERTVRIDNLRRGTCSTGSSSASTRSGRAPGWRHWRRRRSSGCARSPPRSATRRPRGETGYPAMWPADRIEVIVDCLRWLLVERDEPTIRQLPLGACEARFGPRYPGEEAGTLSRDEPIEVDVGGRTLRLAGRIDRITWDAEPPTRFRVIDYETGKVRDEKPAQLQGGRMLQLPPLRVRRR